MTDQDHPAGLVEALKEVNGGLSSEDARVLIDAVRAYYASEGVTDMDRAAVDAMDEALGFLTEVERPILGQAFAAHRCAAALPEAVREAWMPIKTAPKDGTVFLAYVAPHVEAVVIATNGECCIINTYDRIVVRPTHWQPLPAAPENPMNALQRMGQEFDAAPGATPQPDPRDAVIAELRVANARLRDGYADAHAGMQYTLQEHGKLSGVGFYRVFDHYHEWVIMPEREGLAAGSHKLAKLDATPAAAEKGVERG